MGNQLITKTPYNNTPDRCTAARHVVVIGGMNMDLGASPSAALKLRDSNPGRIRLRPGGVGRNIAHDLRLLGLDVSLVTALGGDVFAGALKESCRELGIDLSMAREMPAERSGVYLYVTDEAGDMALAVSDMELMAAITPEYLAPRMERINRADAVILDANLRSETLRYAAENCTAPLYADPVSTAKAGKLKGILHRLHTLKPNALEAEALTGEKDPERAALALREAGVKRVFISLGAEGLLAAGERELIRLPCVKTEVVNTNGAGDAATAALVWAGVLGLDLSRAAQAAALAGAITAGSGETNPAELRILPGRFGRKEKG